MRDIILKLIQKYNLQPHPEGGWYKEVYRSTDTISPPERFDGNTRNCSTSIYFLLESKDMSAFHRLKADEVWHFYSGSPINIHCIHPNGALETIKLGNPIDDDQADFQAIIKAGTWFAAKVANPDTFTLVGCTVSPGFDFQDFEMANRRDLIDAFPQHESIIEGFTRKL